MKKAIYSSVVFIFVLYLLSANYVFNVVVKTDKEAPGVKLDLPNESQSVVFAIDEIKKTKIEWKDALYFRGWAFNEIDQINDKELYFVIKSTNRTFVYKIKDLRINRPDVTKGFKLNENVHNHGFEFYIPLYKLKQGVYNLGFVIKDKTGIHYSENSRKGKMMVVTIDNHVFYGNQESISIVK